MAINFTFDYAKDFLNENDIVGLTPAIYAAHDTLENKNGNKFDLNTTRLIPSGLYKVYQKRNEIACPYKSTILLNGVVVDNLAYDIIVQENGERHFKRSVPR